MRGMKSALLVVVIDRLTPSKIAGNASKAL
jgi:hypothetical protein